MPIRTKLVVTTIVLLTTLSGCTLLNQWTGAANKAELEAFAQATRDAAAVAQQEAIDWRTRADEALANEQGELAQLAERNSEMGLQLAAFLKEKAAVAADAAASASDGDFFGAIKTIATLLPPHIGMPVLLATTVGGALFGGSERKKKNEEKGQRKLFEKATTELVTGIDKNGSLSDSLRADLEAATTGSTKDVITMIKRGLHTAAAVAKVT